MAAVAVAGCKGTESGTGGPADIGGTVVIATPSDAGTMLPGLVASVTDREVTDLLYDRLAEIGADLNTIGDKGFKPQLAERWVWGKDSLSIAFHINPHAHWHDGLPVRASDVRYSVALSKDPAFGSSTQVFLGDIDSTSVADSATAVVWFKRRAPEQFYNVVYQIPIVPEHILANTPAAQLKTADVGRHGIGSGRFRLARWEPGSRIELVADTTNYRGRPKLDRIVFAVAPDFDAAVTRFFAGDADVFENLRAEQIARLANDSVRRAQRLPILGYVHLAFNLVDPKAPSRPHPIFSERAVRRALTMATDRRAMVQSAFGSIGQQLYGPFPHSLAVADTTLPQIPYDTTKARALLDSAGWVLGPDGVRSKNGVRLEFSIAVPSSSAGRKQYAVLLQEAFRRVGASARIDQSDFASYVARLPTHNFDAELHNYNTDPSVSGLMQSWSSASIASNGGNVSSYSNPLVDAMLDSAVNAFDPARTRAYARRAFEMIIEDAPGIWLYEPPTMAGIAKRIHTANIRADGYFAGMGEWWIPSNERNQRDRIGLRPTP